MTWSGASSGEHFVASNPPSLKTNFGIYNVVTDYGADNTGAVDCGAKVNSAVAAAFAAGGGQVYFPPGTYLLNTSVTPKNNVSYVAAPRTVTLKRNVAGDLFVTSVGLSRATWLGIEFDCLATASCSALNLIGSDASGQVSDVLVRDCRFKNPGTVWLVQINYTIVDPTIPTSKNSNVRFEDCLVDSTGQVGTAETLIVVNTQDCAFEGCRFLNRTNTQASDISIYGYSRDVRVTGCHFENYQSNQAIYIQQSDSVKIIGNEFRTTFNVRCVTLFSSKDVDILGNYFSTGNAGLAVLVKDFAGTTFDGHTNLYAFTSVLKVQGNRGDVSNSFLQLDMSSTQGQTDIFCDSNIVSVLRNLVILSGIPAAPSATIKRLFIRGNHVVSHSGFTNTGCISILGNASAPNGGVQTIVIADNLIPASGAGSGTDIEIINLADDVWINDNRLGSPIATSLQLAAAVTNPVVISNVMAGSPTPATSALGANVTSATFTGNNYRGTIAVVMAGALAANTRIATCTFPTSPYGATAPRIRLINQTAGAGLANVNFYVQAQATGVSFDIACDQALAAGTYTVAYDITPAGLS